MVVSLQSLGSLKEILCCILFLYVTKHFLFVNPFSLFFMLTQIGYCLGTLIKTYMAALLPFFDELSTYLTPIRATTNQVKRDGLPFASLMMCRRNKFLYE